MRWINRVLVVALGICLLSLICGTRQIEASPINYEKMSDKEIRGSSHDLGVVFSIVETDMIRMNLRFGDIVLIVEKGISSGGGFYLQASSINNGGIVKLTDKDNQVIQKLMSEMSAYGDNNNLSKSFLSILNLIVSWPNTMPVYVSISNSGINTLTGEYKQQSHSRLTPLSDYKPLNLCNAFGKTLDLFWPVQVSGTTVATLDQSGIIGQDGCFGRCGPGCSSYSTATFNNVYSYACARHDACVGYQNSILGVTNTVWPDCDYLFPATIPDFIIGVLGTSYNGTQYNCSTIGS
ncbi:hypothetical protein [Candidatus Magnetominusculus dajiuhuensis]|uniref:hypothetical protein n=1 Tax=Candidatus Magnetominusculus dajiuhuensis TaxID=3137712 RepID=UPI003B43A48C